MTRAEVVECLSKGHPFWNRCAIESLLSRLESLNLIKFDPPIDRHKFEAVDEALHLVKTYDLRNPFGPAPPRHDLARLVAEANARFDALTPEEQRAHREAQRKSWVIGELMLEHPDLTKEQAELRYARAKDSL